MPEQQISEKIVREAFDKSTEKSHVIAIWVGIVLNLLWVVSDYFVLIDHIVPFSIFRLCVSVISLVVLINRKSFGIDIYGCMFILVTGISVQNAYMWSVMDIVHLQQHTFAYIVLFIGVGMLVLWEVYLSVLLAFVTIVANIVFFLLNSELQLGEFLINGALITFSVVIFCIFLIRSRHRLTFNEIRIRMALEQSKEMLEQKHAEVLDQKQEIQTQKDAIEAKNRETTDSISYARNIQSALIPSPEKFAGILKESFVLHQPKDIVSGDFYWIYNHREVVYYVTADCTGHGVPGGFMTMLGLSFLEQIIVNQGIEEPAIVLNTMRDKIIRTLNQYGEESSNKDGMDLNVCRLDLTTGELCFAAANNNIYLIRNAVSDTAEKTLEVYKADRQPCGYHILQKPFTQHQTVLKPGDCIYTFSDGFADQFGGPRGKKFRYKQFERLLLENAHKDMEEQRRNLWTALKDWRGTQEQVDDILVIGVRMPA